MLKAVVRVCRWLLEIAFGTTPGLWLFIARYFALTSLVGWALEESNLFSVMVLKEGEDSMVTSVCGVNMR
ncbi:MAG: hypothetical protein VYA34_04565 [Myxococcota bacterium]|nr:hypothetical protein [Myxococcota bacterium]